MIIPLARPSLTQMERGFVQGTMQGGWISGTGSNIGLFQEEFAEHVDRKRAVAVTNGTVALELALKALGIGLGDKVIVPALTFAAPAAAVVNVGAKPIFVDVNADDWTINSQQVLHYLDRHPGHHVKAVIGVDLMGIPFNLGYLDSVLYKFSPRIHIIEDAAQAHGAGYESGHLKIPTGSIGSISTFSFHANKAITSGEGGMVVTDHDELADLVQLIANHGMTGAAPYWHEVVGTNNRMTNLTAAIGLAQVRRWDELMAARRKIADGYRERLKDLFDKDMLKPRPIPTWAKESVWLYTVSSPIRKIYLDALNAANVDARAIWPALPDVPAYQQLADGDYPVARKVSREAFWLPTWVGMTDTDLDYICEVIHETARQFYPESEQ